MLEITHALGAGACVACGEAPASGGLAEALCDACQEAWPPWLVPLRACPPGVDAGWHLGPYAGPVGAVVRRGKYGPDPALIEALGRELARALGAVEVDVVVPAPSAWTTVLRRGFAPGVLLAEPIAAALGRPLLRALGRRWGRRQAAVGRRERAGNVHVHLRHALPAGARVLLVDDVLTTGATATACADALREAGAGEVSLLVAAAARQSVSSL